MMNVQTDDVTRQRMALYRKTMAESGFDEAHIAQAVNETWVWRNIFVAETDAEAKRIGIPLFEAQREQRGKMRASHDNFRLSTGNPQAIPVTYPQDILQNLHFVLARLTQQESA